MRFWRVTVSVREGLKVIYFERIHAGIAVVVSFLREMMSAQTTAAGKCFAFSGESDRAEEIDYVRQKIVDKDEYKTHS